MFSMHRELDSALVSWKVRTMPSAGDLVGAARPASDLPLNVQSPSSGWSKPVSRLKNVVLPAPLGPISAVIDAALDLEVVDVDGGEAAERAA